MLLSRVHNESTSVHIDGQDITNCKNLKLLGVTIGSDLMFRSHIQEICINTRKKIRVRSRLKNMISTETKLHFYKYAILSNLM